MDTRGGELVGQVAGARGEQQLLEGAVVQLRTVRELDLLAVARKTAVALLDEGPQAGDILAAPRMDEPSVLGELAVVDGEHRLVGHVLEQPVALGQHGVVAHDGRQIGAVELRDEAVEVAAPLVGRIADERRVGRRDNHHGDEPHVVRQPLVLLAVALEHLAPLAGKGAGDQLGASGVGQVAPLDHEEICAVADALTVGHAERRLAHREVVDRLHDVGLAGAVVPHKAVDAGAEPELLLGNILEVEQR